MCKPTKIYVKLCIFLIVISCGQTRAGFMEMDPTTMAKAYVDAYFDGIEDIAHKHTNHSTEQHNSELCYKQLKYLRNQLENREIWAVKVLDSWGKVPSGLMSGNIVSLGNFDQCVAVRKSSNDTIIGEFRGQYCLSEIGPIINENDTNFKTLSADLGVSIGSIKKLPKLGLAVCIPATCSPQMLFDILDPMLKNIKFELGNKFLNDGCQTDDPMPLNGIDYFAIIFFTLILIVMILSTIIELIYIRLDKHPPRALLMFSMFTNGKKILNLKKSKSVDAVHCIDGLKAISMMFIIYAHEFLGFILTPATNVLVVFDIFKSYTGAIGISALFAVDTFLVVTGFLISWLGLKVITKSKGRVNIPLMYIHRLLRLVPLVLASALFQLCIFKLLGDGPIWRLAVKPSVEHCRTNFWSSISFISNYYSYDTPCPDVIWYVAADMQLYFCAPFLLLAFWKFGKKAYAIIPVCAAISIVCSYYEAMKYEIAFKDILLFPDKMFTFQMKLVNPTHIRMVAWAIGFALGVYMHGLREKKVRISKVGLIIGWALALLIIFGCPAEFHRLISNDTIEGYTETAIFIAIKNTLWSLAVAWIIFTGYYGYGGPINYFLSLPIFRPISKLTLSMYLTHNFVYITGFAITRTSLYINKYLILQKAIGDITIVSIVAIFVSLGFESPIAQFEKILFGSDRKTVEISNFVYNMPDTGKITLKSETK